MALLPFNTFPGMIFLEARLLAQPSAIVSQIGLSIDAPDCSVAVFSRTSGVLLVAGVGSYCAYRICTKYLGRRFVWMLLESSGTSTLASADRRLLYDCNYGSNVVIEELDEEDEDPEGDTQSVEEWKEKVSLSRPASQISRHSLGRQSARARGLFSLRHAHRPREGVLSRRSSAGSQAPSIRSPSPSGSECSASLRIVWEGGQSWDDEFDNLPASSGVVRRRMGPTISTTDNVPAPSIGDLCSVFDDVLSVTSGLDQNQDDVLLGPSGEDDGDEPQLSHIKCMTDSKYMYSSLVAGSDFGSDAGSLISTSSRLQAFRREPPNKSGLWSLSPEEPSTSEQMVDSALTRSSHSKKSSHGGPSMFDSAIGTDLMSSEDGSIGYTRTHLNPLRESDSVSIAPSEFSMEWCEDDGLRDFSTGDDNLLVSFNPDNLDWDMDSTPLHRNESKNCLGVSPSHRPSTSRDLMVVACQTFQPYSPQFKLFHDLYHRRRYRRISAPFGPETSQRQLDLLLTSLLYHRQRITYDSDWTSLEKRFDDCLLQCDFLHKWTDRTEKDLRRQLRAIWDLADLRLSGLTDNHRKGFEVLLVLEAKAAYDSKMKGSDVSWLTHDSPATVLHLLESNQPLDEVCWHLVSRICDVSLELFDAQSGQSHLLGSSSCSGAPLPWLNMDSLLSPLFYVPDD